jgi:hypothetical protein
VPRFLPMTIHVLALASFCLTLLSGLTACILYMRLLNRQGGSGGIPDSGFVSRVGLALSPAEIKVMRPGLRRSASVALLVMLILLGLTFSLAIADRMLDGIP